MILPPPGKKPQVLQYQTGYARAIVSADIGQQRDHTGIAVLVEHEIRGDWDPAWYTWEWHKQTTVQHVERMPLMVSYPEIVARIKEVADWVREWGTRPTDGVWSHCGLSKLSAVVVDATGSGMPVVDLLRQEQLNTVLAPVMITSGDVAHREGDLWRVPKRDVVTNLQIILAQKRLKFSGKIAQASLLTQEMQNMRVKNSAHGNEKFGCWREGEHDDLVLAVGLGSWWLAKAR